jgi:hypothetical protein
LVIAGRLLKEYSQWGLAQRWSGSTLQDAQDGGLWELLQKALTVLVETNHWLLSWSYKQRGSEFELSASVGSVNNMNKLSLVGLQLPEKYKENFNVSNEGPSSGVQNVEIPLYILQVVGISCIVSLPTTACSGLTSTTSHWLYSIHLIG